jgi:hypothetical protein
MILIFATIILVCTAANEDRVVPVWVDNSICNIPRVDSLSQYQFDLEFKGQSPVVFRRPLDMTEITRALFAKDVLLEKFGGQNVNPSTLKLDIFKREILLSHYVEELMHPHGPETAADANWYLFNTIKNISCNQAGSFAPLVQNYPLPLDTASQLDHLAWGLATLYSGIAFHTHGAAFSETLLGRKRFYLAAPLASPLAQSAVSLQDRSGQALINSQLNWVISRGEHANESDVLECTMGPGEVLYVPPLWWHATLNLEPWTAFISTFTKEAFERRAPLPPPTILPGFNPSESAEKLEL